MTPFTQRVAGIFRKAVQWLSKSNDGVLPQGWRELSSTDYDTAGKRTVQPTARELCEEYRRGLWTYACVHAKCRYAAGMPIRLRREMKDGEDDIVKDHPVLSLLYDPAPKTTWANLIEGIVAHLDLAGRSFLEKVRAKGKKSGPPVSLFMLMPHIMKATIDATEGIVGYDYGPGITNTHFEPDDVVWFRTFDPLDDFGGIGPGLSSWVTEMLDRSAREWNASFFERMAVPDTILSTEKAINPGDRERIKQEWLNQLQGKRKSRGVVVLQHGLEAKQYSESHRDMQFGQSMDRTRDEMIAAYGVPPVLVGITASVNRANAVAQIQIFRDFVMMPMMAMILETLTTEVIESFPDSEGLYLEVDYEKLLLPEEQAAIHAQVAADVTATILTVDEARAKIGLPPMPKPEEAPIGADGLPIPGAASPLPKPEPVEPEVSADEQKNEQVEAKRKEPKVGASAEVAKAQSPFGPGRSGASGAKSAAAPQSDIVTQAADRPPRTPWQLDKARRRIEEKATPALQREMERRLAAQRDAILRLVRGRLKKAHSYDTDFLLRGAGK